MADPPTLARKLGVRHEAVVLLDLASVPGALRGDLDRLLTAALDEVGGRATRRLPAAIELGLTAHVAGASLERRLPALLERLTPAGALWVAWPKKSARRALVERHGVVVDLDDAGVRSTALAAGVVDVKVAALDDTWSALKLVRRLVDR